MMVIALLVPPVLMCLVFALDAFEAYLFPPPPRPLPDEPPEPAGSESAAE
ncbi:hypothetical protein ACWC10_16940 [Streptomyces sp. NPDC001595]